MYATPITLPKNVNLGKLTFILIKTHLNRRCNYDTVLQLHVSYMNYILYDGFSYVKHY